MNCRQCLDEAAYGFEPGVPLRCAQHRRKGMIDVVDVRCQVCSTNVDVCYGVETRKPIRCGNCRKDRDLLVWPAATCATCGRYLIYGTQPGQPLICRQCPGWLEALHTQGYYNVSRAPCLGGPQGVCKKKPKWSRVVLGDGDPEYCTEHKRELVKRQRSLKFVQVVR